MNKAYWYHMSSTCLSHDCLRWRVRRHSRCSGWWSWTLSRRECRSLRMHYRWQNHPPSTSPPLPLYPSPPLRAPLLYLSLLHTLPPTNPLSPPSPSTSFISFPPPHPSPTNPLSPPSPSTSLISFSPSTHPSPHSSPLSPPARH